MKKTTSSYQTRHMHVYRKKRKEFFFWWKNKINLMAEHYIRKYHHQQRGIPIGAVSISSKKRVLGAHEKSIDG